MLVFLNIFFTALNVAQKFDFKNKSSLCLPYLSTAGLIPRERRSVPHIPLVTLWWGDLLPQEPPHHEESLSCHLLTASLSHHLAVPAGSLTPVAQLPPVLTPSVSTSPLADASLKMLQRAEREQLSLLCLCFGLGLPVLGSQGQMCSLRIVRLWGWMGPFHPLLQRTIK